jgi:hypothetical protein
MRVGKGCDDVESGSGVIVNGWLLSLETVECTRSKRSTMEFRSCQQGETRNLTTK